MPDHKTFKSSSMQREPRFGRGPNVAGVQVLGTIHFDEDDELDDDDVIDICWIPDNAYMWAYQFNFPQIHGSMELELRDYHQEEWRDPRDMDEFEPTIYANEIHTAKTGGVFTAADAPVDDLEAFGTMYAATPREIGRDGAAVKRWKRGTVLQFRITSGHGAVGKKVNIVYLIQFAPTYDAGT